MTSHCDAGSSYDLMTAQQVAETVIDMLQPLVKGGVELKNMVSLVLFSSMTDDELSADCVTVRSTRSCRPSKETLGGLSR